MLTSGPTGATRSRSSALTEHDMMLSSRFEGRGGAKASQLTRRDLTSLDSSLDEINGRRALSLRMVSVARYSRFREAFAAPSQTATLRAARQTATVLHSFPSPERWKKTNRKAQREFVALGIVCARQSRARPCPQRRAHAQEMYTPANSHEATLQNPTASETKPPNQALQTTSMARRAFGKVPVFDRHRRGV